MSGISIERFLSVAREQSDGDIRMRFENETKLVNKGTLFNRLATSLNRGGDQDSKNDRTNVAIAKFREALTDRYGDIGADALAQALEEHNQGLEDGQQQKFNGHVVKRAAQLALEGLQTSRATNKEILANTTIQDARPEVRQAFEERFEQALAVRTNVFTRSLSDQDVNTLKAQVTRQVRDLALVDGGLANSNAARKDLREALQAVVVSIANKQSPGDLIPKLLEVERLQKALLAVEQDDDETGADKTQAQTYNALRTQELASPGFIADLQRRGLADGSALRAVYAAAKEILDSEGSSPEQQSHAASLMRQCEALVSTIGSTTKRPLLELTTDDINQLKRTNTVDPKQLGIAQQTLAPIFLQWDGATKPCRDFLAEVRDEFSKLVHRDDGLQTFAWDSTELCQRLETSIQNSCNDQTSHEVAIKNHRTGIERDQTLHPGLKDKMLATLDALEAERQLAATMKSSYRLDDFPEKDIWRLVVPGNQQGHGASKWDGDQEIQGSYAGLCRGLSEVLKQNQTHAPLDGRNLGTIHEATTNGNIRQNDLRHLYGSTGTTRQVLDTARNNHRVDGSFRQGGNDKWLEMDKDVTQDGARELAQYTSNHQTWFNDSGKVDKEFKLSLAWVDAPDECRQRADDILYQFTMLSRGATDDRKLELVANAVQQLHRSHLFSDDDGGKTAVTLMTNRLLMSVGQRPAILENPNLVMGCSVSAFIEQIKAGQERFNDVRHGNV